MNRSLKNAKLTEQEVIGMRQRVLIDQVSTVKIEAQRYGLARETIRRALRGETFVNAGGHLEEAGLAPVNHPMSPGMEEIHASIRKLAELQKPKERKVVDPRAAELLKARGLGDFLAPPEEPPTGPIEFDGEGKGEEHGN